MGYICCYPIINNHLSRVSIHTKDRVPAMIVDITTRSDSFFFVHIPLPESKKASEQVILIRYDGYVDRVISQPGFFNPNAFSL